MAIKLAYIYFPYENSGGDGVEIRALIMMSDTDRSDNQPDRSDKN